MLTDYVPALGTPDEGGVYLPAFSITNLMDYINVGSSNCDRTKAFIAGVGYDPGLHKAETDIDRIIQLDNGREASHHSSVARIRAALEEPS